jgi:signal transduction histidine kinase
LNVAFQSVAPILLLSPNQAAKNPPVHIRAVVTKPTEQGLFMQDRTGGIWVRGDHADLHAGDEVQVDGIVRPGLFSPVIKASSIRKVGVAALPLPRVVTFENLSTGTFESQFVSIEGTVRSVGLRPNVLPSERLWIKLSRGSASIYAALPEAEAAQAANLIDSTVRINAVATSTKNRNGQITAPILTVAGMQAITVLKQPSVGPFDRAALPIGRLMQYRSGTDYEHRVRVAGTVTYAKSGESVILQDTTGAVFVQTDQYMSLQAGDEVEASGFPSPRKSGPVLENSVFRFIHHGQAPSPTPVSVDDFLAGVFNNRLVSLEGRTVRWFREPTREYLLLQSNSTLLVAELPYGSDGVGLRKIPEGSTVRVAGVSVVEVEGLWGVGGTGAVTIRSMLLLRSPADVTIINPPSWWSTQHLILLALFLAFLLLAATVLGVYKQTEHWKLQAILTERERLANEIHDTLAQSFAGIGFQLQAIRDSVSEDSTQLRQKVDVAYDLVRHSHKEAQRSLDPKESFPRDADLLAALVVSVNKLVEGGSVRVESHAQGTQRALRPRVYGALLRIGQEAIANAVRHANPNSITISARYEPKLLTLVIQDDGVGFAISGSLLGFGIRGMRRRAALVGAHLKIHSGPGLGTRVEVVAQLPAEFSPSVAFGRLREFILEGRSYARRRREAQPDSDSDR